MVDPIERQDAIDAIVAWTVEDRPDVEMPTDLIDRIKVLPSAQSEIVRCKDCKHYLRPHGCSHIDGMVTAQENGFCSYAERREE